MKGFFTIVGLAIFISIGYITKEETINVEDLEKIHQCSNVYSGVPPVIPRIAGFSLKILPKILRIPIIGPFVLAVLKKKNNLISVRKLASMLDDHPLYYSLKVRSKGQLERENNKANLFDLDDFIKTQQIELGNSTSKFKYWSIKDYRTKYFSGELTPTQVAKTLIKLINETNTKHKLKAIVVLNEDNILYEAELSTQRYIKKETKGVLDGVPITVKDSVDVKGYETTHGTSFLKEVAEEDCFSVARLRAQGALIMGKGNLHEIGLGTTGHNTFFGPARNPHNLKHFTGGSSSGSSAAVAAGLVPLAVGTDGGGSIRIPSSLCGVVGLNPTLNRISLKFNQASTVSNIGPIAATVEDVAIGYTIMSGALQGNEGIINPKIDSASFENIYDLSDVRIGVFSDHIQDSKHEGTINATKKAIEFYRQKGANIIEITVPHMQEMKLAHSIIFLAELVQLYDKNYQHIYKFALETQIIMEIGRSLSTRDYLAARRVRSYAMAIYDKVFDEVDVILSPGTSMPAPLIPEDALEGEMNLVQTTNLMKYATIGNFIGIPGIVFPIEYDSEKGLPIALQLQGRHWEEYLLLRLAHAGEGILKDGKKKPDLFVDVINEAIKY